MDLEEVFLVEQYRVALVFFVFEVSEGEKVVEGIDIRILNFFKALVFCFFLELEENGLSFDEALEVDNFFRTFMDDFALFGRQLINNCRVLVVAIKIIGQ